MRVDIQHGGGLHVPAGAYSLDLQVRSYEVARSGTVTQAMILRYLEHLATQASAERGYDYAWYERTGSAWVVRDMQLVFGRLPVMDDRLRMATWLSDFRRVQAFREYAIWKPATGQLITRARARWAYIDRYKGTPRRIPDELLGNFDTLGFAMPTRAFAVPEGRFSTDRYALRAREYEADSQQHINNCAYADWLDEAAYAALQSEADGQRQVLVPRALHIEYIRSAQPGDSVVIETRSRLRPRAVEISQDVRHEDTGVVLVKAQALRLLMPVGHRV